MKLVDVLRNGLRLVKTEIRLLTQRNSSTVSSVKDYSCREVESGMPLDDPSRKPSTVSYYLCLTPEKESESYFMTLWLSAEQEAVLGSTFLPSGGEERRFTAWVGAVQER